MALQSLSQWLKAYGKTLKIVFYITIISVIVLVARDQFAAISGSQLREIFVDTSMHVNAIIMALGLIASSATGLYDLVAFKYVGVEVLPREALKIGWIAQAFNNFAGFGGLTGDTIRTKYYIWASAGRDRSTGVPASVWAANLLGLFVLLAITLPYAVHFNGWLIVVAIISCTYLPLFFLADRLRRLFCFQSALIFPCSYSEWIKHRKM